MLFIVKSSKDLYLMYIIMDFTYSFPDLFLEERFHKVDKPLDNW